MNALAILHTQAVSHPLIVFGLAWGGLHLGARHLHPGPRVWRHVAVLSMAVLVAIGAWYLQVPQYSDHAEPGVVSISWTTLQGGRPYHGLDEPVRYAYPYGPVLYFANAAALALFAPSLPSSKLTGVVAALLSVVLLAWAVRRSGRPAAAAVCFAVAGYLACGSAAFWTRAEPLLLVLIGVSLVGVTVSRPAGAAMIVGAAAGLGAATKITAVIYLLPVFVMLVRRHGTKAAAIGLVTAGAAFAWPFAISGSVTLHDYLAWLGAATRHGLRWRSLPSMFAWAILLLLGPVVALTRARGELTPVERAGNLMLAAVVVATFWLAAKQGTGPHHFLPFVPVIAFAAISPVVARGRSGRVTASVVLSLFIIGGLEQWDWIAPVRRSADPGAVRELETLAARFGPGVAMGYSSVYRPSFLRPVLVFRSEPNILDAVSLMDGQVAGDPFPAIATTIRSCAMAAWLLPRGGEPFALTSAYLPGTPVFPPEFVATFTSAYQRAERGTYFDVWTCRR